MIRVVFLISSLNRGGAERQLTILTKGMDRSRFALTVVTIYDGGDFRTEIEGMEGVQILSLHKQGRSDIPRSLWRLARIMARINPHIVHGYLNVANELALVFGKLARAKIVWGLRASNIDYSLYDRASEWHFRTAARLSRFADLIIANSQAGELHHVANGFSNKNLIVIANGFDTNLFHPNSDEGLSIRRKWGISGNESLIGLAARLDPIKDHLTFLRAAALLAEERGNVRFVCIGSGPETYRNDLEAVANSLGLGQRLIWAGEMSDMSAAYNALDVGTSTSLSEGFSNTIGEAMACGVPCVVTDVGDSAILVGPTGLIVPPDNAHALKNAWTTLLNLPSEQRMALGMAARHRIVAEYSLEALTRKTEQAFAELLR